MVYIRTDERFLLFRGRVIIRATSPGFLFVVVVVAPFCEVVCEFKARGIGGCVFEVDDDELFVD